MSGWVSLWGDVGWVGWVAQTWMGGMGWVGGVCVGWVGWVWGVVGWGGVGWDRVGWAGWLKSEVNDYWPTILQF